MARLFLKIVLWILYDSLDTHIDSCSVSLTSKTNFVDMNSEITLSCLLCNVSEVTRIEYRHNDERVAVLIFGIPSVRNSSSFKLESLSYGQEISELHLKVLKFSDASIGTYTCFINETSKSSLYLTLKVPVENVTLIPEIQTVSVLSGVVINYISCVSSIGRPTPKITWYLDNRTPFDYSDDVNLTGNSNNTVIADVTTSTLSVAFTVKEHSERIYCNVSNGYTPVISKRTLLIDVLDPPSVPLCQIGKSTIKSNIIRAAKNDRFVMTCASKSHPAPLRYKWILPWGEEQNGTQLTIETLRESSNNVYTLEVINEMKATFSNEIVKGNLTTSFTIEILSPPAAQFIGNYTVPLNTTLSVVCPYMPGNPPETRFMWFRGNTSLIRSEQTLSLTRLKIADEGSYTCKISNILDPTGRDIEEAFDETTFYVDVKYPSTIKRFNIDGLFSTNITSIIEGQNVTLYCEADSDPVAVLQIVNKTRGTEHLLREIHDNTISARVSNARCEYDMGVYQCKGNNSYNAVKQVMEFEIMILCSPRPSPFTPPIKTSFRKMNTSVILSFTIVAYPPPNGKSAYSWRKLVEQYWEPINNTSRHQISISDDRLKSSLLLAQLQNDDFTNYSVRVYNDLGFTEHVFVLRENESPAMPQGFHVIHAMVTEDSLTIEWMPGMNGDEDQKYIIGYKKVADETWTYKTVKSTLTRVAIVELAAGTMYDVKMYAENSVGKSNETIKISVMTKTAVSVQNSIGSSSSTLIGSSVGGAVGGTLVAVSLVLVIWKYKKNLQRVTSPASIYDDLFRPQAINQYANLNAEYDTCKVESQRVNQYESLAEMSSHVYSYLTPNDNQEAQAKTNAPFNQVLDIELDLKKDENAYVNMELHSS